MALFNAPEKRKTEIRKGIGLCDSCGEPRWPQTYMGYGNMICEDCLQSVKVLLRKRKKK